MYYSCHCIKRNGLQHDCRRTGCGGEPACLVLPDPLCAPSQLARNRGLADPAPLAAHYRAQGGGSAGPAESSAGSGGGKRFIVCELKGIVPDVSTKAEQCCKCPPFNTKVNDLNFTNQSANCGCDSNNNPTNSLFVFDEKTIETILSRFQNKELAPSNMVRGPGGRLREVKAVVKEEPCTRPGCVHWKPPPPCLWDAPCKADCFETPPGIQPGRNPLSSSGGSKIPNLVAPHKKMVVLSPIQ